MDSSPKELAAQAKQKDDERVRAKAEEKALLQRELAEISRQEAALRNMRSTATAKLSKLG